MNNFFTFLLVCLATLDQKAGAVFDHPTRTLEVMRAVSRPSDSMLWIRLNLTCHRPIFCLAIYYIELDNLMVPTNRHDDMKFMPVRCVNGSEFIHEEFVVYSGFDPSEHYEPAVVVYHDCLIERRGGPRSELQFNLPNLLIGGEIQVHDIKQDLTDQGGVMYEPTNSWRFTRMDWELSFENWEDKRDTSDWLRFGENVKDRSRLFKKPCFEHFVDENSIEKYIPCRPPVPTTSTAEPSTTTQPTTAPPTTTSSGPSTTEEFVAHPTDPYHHYYVSTFPPVAENSGNSDADTATSPTLDPVGSTTTSNVMGSETPATTVMHNVSESKNGTPTATDSLVLEALTTPASSDNDSSTTLLPTDTVFPTPSAAISGSEAPTTPAGSDNDASTTLSPTEQFTSSLSTAIPASEASTTPASFDTDALTTLTATDVSSSSKYGNPTLMLTLNDDSNKFTPTLSSTSETLPPTHQSSISYHELSAATTLASYSHRLTLTLTNVPTLETATPLSSSASSTFAPVDIPNNSDPSTASSSHHSHSKTSTTTDVSNTAHFESSTPSSSSDTTDSQAYPLLSKSNTPSDIEPSNSTLFDSLSDSSNSTSSSSSEN